MLRLRPTGVACPEPSRRGLSMSGCGSRCANPLWSDLERKRQRFSSAHLEVSRMAKQQTANTQSSELQVIRYLTEVAKADTIYRDLYLQRASARLAALLPKTEYEQLKVQDSTIENLLA